MKAVHYLSFICLFCFGAAVQISCVYRGQTNIPDSWFFSFDCLKRGHSDHTCHQPRGFTALDTESENWNGKLRLTCVNDRHPHSKTPVDVLWMSCSVDVLFCGCSVMDMLESKEMTEQM